MRLPTPREPRHGSSRWEVIRYALGSNARAARFCLIWLVMTGGPFGAVVVWLLSHIRLRCACSVRPCGQLAAMSATRSSSNRTASSAGLSMVLLMAAPVFRVLMPTSLTAAHDGTSQLSFWLYQR
jgi:hypothetical protein